MEDDAPEPKHVPHVVGIEQSTLIVCCIMAVICTITVPAIAEVMKALAGDTTAIQWADMFAARVQPILTCLVGAAAAYVVTTVQQNAQFEALKFCVHLVAASLIGTGAAYFIPPTIDGRSGFLMIAGGIAPVLLRRYQRQIISGITG